MNCFNHRSVTAVATCKNCSKGLCPECLTEVENGIACSATCVEEVKTLNSLINTNKNATKRVAGNYYRAMFIYFAMAILFLSTGLIYAELKFYMLTASGIFLIGGFLTFISAGKYKKA